ncbi:LysR family transcriptional regulator [Thioclava sp. BHET1]|nr:LysR family transcriptional regulator [Thioclava sp. BHET1]
MRDINLKATEYFEAVVRLGTVTKAASELGVSPSAVSQQIRALEEQFGVLLFRREKRRLVLTLDGDRLFQTTTQVFSALRNARAAISRQREQRSLMLRVSPSFGVRWIGPRIAAFAEENADWNIRIDATPDFSAFDTEPVDFDLRYGIGAWPGLMADCVMNDFVLPLCSPAYLERLRSRGESAAELLRNARLIDSAKTFYRWDIWLATNRIDLGSVSYPFRFDRSSMAIEMAKQGGGVALDSAVLCLDEIERGDLVPILPDRPAIVFPAYWFVTPQRNLNRRIVRRFLDWIKPEARAHEARAREVLGRFCSFTEASELIDVKPWSL